MAFGERVEQGEITAAATAEAKIVADDQPAHAELRHQQVLHELLRREGCERGVEAQHEQAVHAARGDQAALLAQPREARRPAALREILRRLRFEEDDQARQAQPLGMALESLDDLVVPEVHAVEIANRRHTTVVHGPDVVASSDQLHRLLGPDRLRQRIIIRRARASPYRAGADRRATARNHRRQHRSRWRAPASAHGSTPTTSSIVPRARATSAVRPPSTRWQ